MTAAVLYGSEDLRIEMIDVPALSADEVLVRVRLALTDGTDLKVWKRGYHARMIRPPAVFGHELVGELVCRLLLEKKNLFIIIRSNIPTPTSPSGPSAAAGATSLPRQSCRRPGSRLS